MGFFVRPLQFIFSVLLMTLALPGMSFSALERAGETHHPSKNRVGEFFDDSTIRVGENDTFVQYPRWENPIGGTTTASGAFYEGFRYRDLETGTFISRDPLGFVDGPNVYTYVVQNPWTMFDPHGLSSYNPETQELEADEHLNIYEQGGADSEDPNAGLLVNYKEMSGMLDNAEGGFVTLPDGRKVKEGSFRLHVEGNNEILSDSAVKNRSAQESLFKDGHMSYSEALQSQKEIQEGYSVESWAEHWNVRKALNQDDQFEKISKNQKIAESFTNGSVDQIVLFGKETWNRAVGTAYHGPKEDVGFFTPWKAKGVHKWYTNQGREMVFSKEGNFEKRIQYMGTYNFGPVQQIRKGTPHEVLDIRPWNDRGGRTSPYQ